MGRLVSGIWYAILFLFMLGTFGGCSSGSSVDGLPFGMTITNPSQTADDNDLQILTLYPRNGAAGADPTGNLELYFNKSVIKGSSGEILILRLSDNSVFEQIPITDARISASGSRVTIDPTGTLASQTGYQVILGSHLFFDAALHSFTGFVPPASWTFFTGDSGAPLVTATFPRNGNTGVDVTTNLELVFNKTVVKGNSGEVVIRRTSDNAVIETISIGNSIISVASNVVTINPTAGLELQTGYYVTITSGAFVDNSGLAYAGITGVGWSFNTGDGAAPVVVAYSPRAAQSGVGVNEDLVLQFNKPVIKSSSGHITIRRLADNTLFEEILISDTRITVTGDNKLVIDPNGTFDAQTAYYALVTAGCVVDNSGNPNAGSTSNAWSFTTGDNGALVDTAVLPRHNQIGVSLDSNLEMLFSKPIQKGASGQITIRHLADNTVFEEIPISDSRITVSGDKLTINPNNTFTVQTSYYVTITAGTVRDYSYNIFAGYHEGEWIFSTGETGAPIVTGYAPKFSADGVSVNSNLVLQFSKPIHKGTSGKVTIRKFADHTVFEEIPITDPRITVNGDRFTIDPAGTFDAQTGYYVTVSPGIIYDNAQIAYAGLIASSWQFNTGDNGIPVVISHYPKVGQSGVGVNDNLEFTFNKLIQKGGSGQIIIRRLADNATFENIPIDDGRITVTGDKLTVDPAGTFDTQTGYYVTISAGAVCDYSNFCYGGQITTGWSFTTGDNGSPVMLATNPPDNATSVATTSVLEILFSEDVQKGTNASIAVRRLSDASLVEQIPVSSVQVAVAGNRVTIALLAALEYQTSYFINIPPGCFFDKSMNTWAGIVNSSSWNFTTAEAYILSFKWGGGVAGAGNGQFNNPRGISVAANGKVFIADTDNNRVQVFSPTGLYETKWGTFGSGVGQYSSPMGIVADVNGKVFVADTVNHRIRVSDQVGASLPNIGSAGTGNGQFAYPQGVAVNSAGTILYVADTGNDRVQVFDIATSLYSSQWGTRGPGVSEFRSPTGIAVDSTGDVYVVDTDNHRIQKFASDGTPIAQWGTYGSGNGQFNFPHSIAVGPNDEIYVLDTMNHRVQEFTTTGTFVAKFGTSGTGSGQFTSPYGICVDSLGRVYVLDTDNRRIEVFIRQ